MQYIDLHAHMASRSTDDYKMMALTGCVAVSEPAFWAGYDSCTPDYFRDYFHRLTEFEPGRAAEYGIQHYTWLCLNPKEGEDRKMAKAVLGIIPEFMDHPNVLGIGEIGVNRVTQNELATFIDHVDLAVQTDQLIHIHTPHLEDKYKGTKVITDTLLAEQKLKPGKVMVDHAEEHTIEMILDNGFWAGLTLYPTTKVSHNRAVDLIERFGTERICVGSACDWGPSQPIAIPELISEMRRRGHSESTIKKVVYDNPVEFLGQCNKFKLRHTEPDAVLRFE
ncbi:MAG: TatD family hydrolase [Balneolales bacterium]